jgi:hypothetical protein
VTLESIRTFRLAKKSGITSAEGADQRSLWGFGGISTRSVSERTSAVASVNSANESIRGSNDG